MKSKLKKVKDHFAEHGVEYVIGLAWGASVLCSFKLGRCYISKNVTNSLVNAGVEIGYGYARNNGVEGLGEMIRSNILNYK